MKKLQYLTLLLMIMFIDVNAAGDDGEKGSRWQQLFSLVNEEIKTVESVSGSRGPDLEYRLFQLYSERLGLIKEKENATFLNSVMAERVTRSKDSYFVESLKTYQKIKVFGLKIIENYPKHAEIGHIFFTLASNSRDYGKDHMTESYFKKALGYVSSSSALAHSIRVGLAEHYYNEKQFAQATNVYRAVVKNENDEWLAKHYFNLAWCHLKVKEFDTAINNLIMAFNLGRIGSKTPNGLSYIAVTDQVLMAMSIFYVLANRGLEGVQFLIKEVPGPSTYLLKLAHSAAENGQFYEARTALTEALKSEKDSLKLARIRLKELEIYRNFKKDDLFFESAQAFWTLNKNSSQQAELPVEVKEEFLEKTKSMAGQYQMELSKRFTHDLDKNKKINETQLSRILEYFKMIADVFPAQASAYAYYSGETLFVLKRYHHAAQYYEKAILFQKEETPDLIMMKKILNSFFAAISDDNFPKHEWRKMAYLGYGKLLFFYPKDEEAPWSYRELFALNLQDKNISEAEKYLHAYQLNFPQDLSIQKKQFLALLDYYIKAKNIIEINRLIALMPKPPFLFAVDDTEKAMGILGNILFDQFIVLEKQNKLDEAASGLARLADQEIFPAVVRAKAAYNASLIHLGKMEGEQAAKLALSSLGLMPEKEYINYLPKFQKMTFLLAYGQFIDQALVLGVQILKAAGMSQNKTFASMLQEMTMGMIEWNLSLHRFAEAEQLAGRELNEKADLLIAQTYRYLNYQTEYVQFVKTLLQNQHLSKIKEKRETLDHLLTIYLSEFPDKTANGSKSLSVLESCLITLSAFPEITNYYRQALAQHSQFEKLYAELQVPFVAFELEKHIAPFDQNLFNQSLSAGLGQLKDLTNKIETFLKNGNPHYSLYLTYQLSTIYLSNADKIASLNISTGPQELVQAFKKEMKNLSRKIEEKGQSYLKALRKMRLSGFYAGKLNTSVRDRIDLRAVQNRTPASPVSELSMLVD